MILDEENRFIEAHEPWLRILAADWRRKYPFLDENDVLQRARIGLLKARHTYDPAQGASLKTYAETTKIRQALTELRRREEKHIKKCCSLDEPIGNDQDGQPILLADTLLANPLPAPIDPTLLALLPADQAAVVRLSCEEGQTFKEIGGHLGVSEVWASKLFQKAGKNKTLQADPLAFAIREYGLA